MAQTIKIFLASSAELKDDREKFEQFIERKNKTLNKNGRFLELVVWEDFIDAMSQTRLQDEYNKAVSESDIFVMLFATKVGPYTLEEFETAFGQFQESGKPWIYTYFKTEKVDLRNVSEEDFLSLKAFQKRLKAIDHFWTEYKDSTDLKNQFTRQLELRDPFAEQHHLPLQEDIVKKYWQQLIHDSDFNSIVVIGKSERQRLENLYIRLQVTAHGDKTNVGEGFLSRKRDKTQPEKMLFHDMPPYEAISTFHRFVVLGAPGMGKTTMFRFITYTIARLGLGLARTDEFSLEKNVNLVPLYLPLTELGGYSGDLLSCLKDYLLRRFPGCKAIIPALDSLLNKGECLVLLDSLDEVAAAEVRQVKVAIKGFLNNSDWQGNNVLLSCRDASWIKDDLSLSFPAVLQIVDLDDPAIGEYLLHWFSAGDSEAALALKEKICSTPQLKALASNPFLLSLIAWLSQSEKLPERRVELYEKCTTALLNEKFKEQQDRRPTEFGPDHAEIKTSVLADVALEMMQQNLKQIDRRALRKIIRNSIGSNDVTDERPGKLIDEIHLGSALLRETNAEHIYEFQHNTFREYFAAQKLSEAMASLLSGWEKTDPKPKLSDYIKQHPGEMSPLQWMGEPLWTEVNRLTVGLLQKPTAVLELLFETDPTLAARCYLDADPKKVRHASIKKLWTERIDRQQRIEIVRNINDNLPDEKEVLDFIAGIFLTAETDSEVLYSCDYVLRRIGSDDAARTGETMFDHWPRKRQFQTHKQAFAMDKFWQFAEVAGGEFKMGGNEDDDEKPIHPVKISPFYLGCYSVTVEQYHRFDPGHRKAQLDDEFGKNQHQPVVRISWYDAYIFGKWARGRLPTEAEWEYSARGGRKKKGYEYAGSDNLDEVGWYSGNSKDKTGLVGAKKPNELGLYDTSGNVWEWCQDKWHDSYQGAPTDGSAWETGDDSYRVMRGGSWFNYAQYCRCADRNYNYPGHRYDSFFGFRLVFVP